MNQTRNISNSGVSKRMTIEQRIIKTISVALSIATVVMTIIVFVILLSFDIGALGFTSLFAVIFIAFSLIFTFAIKKDLANHTANSLKRLVDVDIASSTTFTARAEDFENPSDEIAVLYAKYAQVSMDYESLLAEIDRIEHAMLTNNWYFRSDIKNMKGSSKVAILKINKIIDVIFNFVDDMPCLIGVFDGERRATYVNKIAREQGFTMDVIGQVVGSDGVLKNVKEVFETGIPSKYTETDVMPNGKTITEEYSFNPLYDLDGKIIGVALVNVDVTKLYEVSAYQKAEAESISEHLKNGLAKGIAQFAYQPNSHDENTAESAESYKLIGNSVAQAVALINDYISEVNEVLSKIAKGDLTIRINREYEGDFASIKNSINDISESLHKTMTEITSASDHVLSGAKEISTTSMNLADGSSQQAASVEELNTSIETIRLLIKDNVQNATTANDLSEKSTDSAKTGNEAVSKMLEAMEQIKQSSNSISGINKVIQDIAFQTNLLALNASVEASRAGEHGKGFAVVADEVRTLAGRSQESASETTKLIQDSIDRVETGFAIAQSTAEALGIIVSNVGEVSQVISNVSASSIEQDDAAQMTTEGIMRIAHVAQDNSVSSQKTAAASEELTSQAEVLRELVAFFKL